MLRCGIVLEWLNKWLLSDVPTLALRHAAKPKRYVNMRAETLYTTLEMDKDSNDK